MDGGWVLRPNVGRDFNSAVSAQARRRFEKCALPGTESESAPCPTKATKTPGAEALGVFDKFSLKVS